MKSPHITSFLRIAVLYVSYALSGCVFLHGGDSGSELRDENTFEILRLIKDTPPWATESEPDVRKFILTRYAKVAKFDTVEIRKSVVQFCTYADSLPPAFRTAEKAKIILLNRLLFAVPTIVSLYETKGGKFILLKRCDYDEGKVYSREPWVLPMPKIEDKCYAIAPLFEESSGVFTLVCDGDVLGRNFFFSGADLIAEFDFFMEKYGRR